MVYCGYCTTLTNIVRTWILSQIIHSLENKTPCVSMAGNNDDIMMITRLSCTY